MTCALLACLFLVGCGGDSVKSQLSKYSEENIQKASLLYSIYTSLNNYQGPKDVEEMLSFFEGNELAQKRLENMSIDSSKLEDYIIGRDGEQYEFIWGLKKNPLAAPYPICYEKTGFEGTFQIGISGGKVHECDSEDELKDIISKPNYEAAESQEPYSPGLSE